MLPHLLTNQITQGEGGKCSAPIKDKSQSLREQGSRDVLGVLSTGSRLASPAKTYYYIPHFSPFLNTL